MKYDELLTSQEKLFCELYANGDAPFAGNLVRCYEEVYQERGSSVKHKALLLISKEAVRQYLDELIEMGYEDGKFMKKFLTQNLMNIVSECSVNSYRDRRGTLLSPAPLRGVAVSAAKALMDMYPVKEAQVSKLNIDGAGEGGITFNVIMPEQRKEDPKIE